MKLKKIASLALAGVLAVSMLAGCGEAGSTNTNNTPDAPVSSIVAAVNDGQKVENKVKITFTANSKMEDAAKAAIEQYGESLDADKLETAMKQHMAIVGATSSTIGFMNDRTANIKDGQTVTYFAVSPSFDSAYVDAAVLNDCANAVDMIVSTLDDTTKVTAQDVEKNPSLTATKVGDTYYDFSYTGDVCLVNVPKANGSTAHYLVVMIEQTAAKKTA